MLRGTSWLSRWIDYETLKCEGAKCMEGSKKVGLWRNDFKASQPETDPSGLLTLSILIQAPLRAKISCRLLNFLRNE